MHIDNKIAEIRDLPYTISYVIRKRMQVDNLNELPKEKRPPDLMIWYGTSEDIDDWIDRVFNKKESDTFTIPISDIEG